MEITGFRDRLCCSICLNIFNVPVTLSCGHNFCRQCITHAMGTQVSSGNYSCPECREEFLNCPALQANSNLQNIVEKLYSKQPETEALTVPCTYCLNSPQPAVKTCLECQSSFCRDHLNVHRKSDKHILIDPVASLEDWKCSVHKKDLSFYCYEEAKCICLNCCLDDHVEHDVEPINEAIEKKKGKMRELLDVLASNENNIDEQISIVREKVRERQEKDIELADKAISQFRTIRKQLDDLEKRVLREIFQAGEEFAQKVSGLIQPLEGKKNELSRKKQYLEKLCNITDPITLLQDLKSDRDDFCVPEKWENSFLSNDSNQGLVPGDLDEGLISETIYTGLCDILSDISKRMSGFEASDIFLDINTASANVTVSQDMKKAWLSWTDQCYPESPERFEDGQILSQRSFSSGRHYWDVETSELGDWMMGLAYSSIDRHGDHSWLGENAKSWCITRYQNQYSVVHNGQEEFIPHQCLSQGFRICLDYDAGSVSFYELSDRIRHLHTFNTIFTEPIHAAFGLLEDKDDCWLRIIS